MSSDKIDKAIYDKARYDSLRDRGVSEDRAKRVATVPLDRFPEGKSKTATSPTERNLKSVPASQLRSSSVKETIAPKHPVSDRP
ncbi:hypothetical protein [Pelagicoccus sp. SDUM812002]|uniref:hypothetical protein n=1 Tax=Pelagicoccus sp. SDUM812002 TaxID=3041266 RepID=UPI00280D724C|nr:hypothetical protein [Pelagicoccus sp. SDUM812002]MDQ8188038.1 hypothetical protein [Pelagicoccus sp. SDUM812002]